MNKIALLFNRTYIDAHHCFMELATQLAENDFDVDLYMPANSNNYQPFFENQRIRILFYPLSKFQRIEFWYRILFSEDCKYKAIIATPVSGAWLAYKTARMQKIPYYYFADELLEHLETGIPTDQKKSFERKNYLANKNAAATISLGEERYELQKRLNQIDYLHDHINIPNAPSGTAVKLKSNYFRDIFNIEDRKPILLFAGTLNWILAKKVYEETKVYGEREYHLIFHARTLGLMGDNDHPFIEISTMPIPSNMLNYAVSSADIGLALYDKHSEKEARNGFTGGKIGTYLKNELPLIAGSAENLRIFQDEKVGVYWDGEMPFDEIALKAIDSMETCRQYIPEFYRRNLQYEFFFQKFKEHLLKSIS